MRPSLGPAGGILLALAFLALAGLVAFSIGAYPVSLPELARWFWSLATGQPSDLPDSTLLVITQIRGPRIVTAMLVGASLAAAGAAYQGLFRNPLVSPDILGVSSGAALGAVLGIFLSLPFLAIQGMAFLGGLGAVGIVYGIAATLRGRDPILILVLAGIVIGTLLGSGISMIKVLADPYNQLPAITFWLLGSLSAVNRDDLLTVLPLTLLGLVPLALLHWRLNVMSFGEEEARALGVNTTRVRLAVIAAATLMTAAVVAISGVVGWIGLVVPHLARLLVGPSFGRLLPTATLFGAAFLLLVDTLARTLGPTEIPLGVLTAIIGAPIFIWLLATSRRHWQ
ncbi:MAG: iron ABC transporter permease [Alphaproteobacteria bacterium]|nr:iron ABC transporter permease [Alphaproteobacteria bacterium]MBU0798169.1 iron ABC transporter permease [Alphaproteobacteria bacterium]MBU0887612.1 iron ABC transporter permease [Alphaproteobacteria bacterium]MBU1814264.1 iron ABC transporter permease [Alphaproteobacteria bacterium]